MSVLAFVVTGAYLVLSLGRNLKLLNFIYQSGGRAGNTTLQQQAHLIQI